jgi:hydroxypyruvate reductase
MIAGKRAINFPHESVSDETRRLYRDANEIIVRSIEANLPGQAVKNALREQFFSEKNLYLLAIGKAAWSMADAAHEEFGGRIKNGVVITKYGHSQGTIGDFEIFEAGHPIADENSEKSAARAIDLANGLGESDELIFLISGGGSSLFEKPLPGLTLADMAEISSHLLANGANITEFNTVRKRLSAVKAGRFAKLCEPAGVFSVVLSDVLGDRLDIIASGPAAPDLSTSAEALGIARRYGLPLSPGLVSCLELETPSETPNVTSVVTGSVRTLCGAASDASRSLGYEPFILTTEMSCEASEAGRMISSMARAIVAGDSAIKPPCAVIFGGETVVHIRGKGLGGRNQELALAAAPGIDGLGGVVIFSFGSDGTDGPTDSAGGIVDGRVMNELRGENLNITSFLDDNDSYNILKRLKGLIRTGPTGTNVNDATIILCR